MGAVKQKLITLGVSTVVVGGLGLYAYLGTYEGKKAEDEKKQADEKLASFKLAEVSAVTLTAKGETFEMIADGEGEKRWRLAKPIATGAEKSTVESLVNHFADMKKKRSFEAKPEDMQRYGLQPAQQTVAFKTIDGKTTTYLVGKKNSFDDNVYLMREGDTQVSTVPNGVVYQVDRDLFQLREKRALMFEDTNVRKFEVEVKGQPAYTIEKRGEDWQITKPIDAKADKPQVTTILSTLRYLRAKSFVVETMPEQDAFGLTKPEAAVNLYLGDANAKSRIVFSTVKEKGGGEMFYAHVDGEKPVLELSESVLKKLDLKPADLRDKLVLAFNRDDVKKLKLAETGKDFVILEKKDTWEIVAPEQKAAQDTKVTNLLYKLTTLKAKQILSDTVNDEQKKKHGLEPVSKQIVLYRGDGTEIGTLVFGAQTDEMVAVLAQGGSRIDGVDRTQLTDVTFDVKDYIKAETAKVGTP